MTKNDIALRIARDMGVQQTDAKEAVQRVLDGIIDVLVTEGRLELRGFGIFWVKTRRPRKARNPKTGASVMVGERKHISFKPGKIMEERVVSGKPKAEPEAAESQAAVSSPPCVSSLM